MNQFDDILKKKLDQEKIKLNPAHLEQFEGMLDLRNKRRVGFLPWMIGVLLLGIVLVFLWQPWQSKESMVSSQIQNVATLLSQNSKLAGESQDELTLLETEDSKDEASNQPQGKEPAVNLVTASFERQISSAAIQYHESPGKTSTYENVNSEQKIGNSKIPSTGSSKGKVITKKASNPVAGYLQPLENDVELSTKATDEQPAASQIKSVTILQGRESNRTSVAVLPIIPAHPQSELNIETLHGIELTLAKYTPTITPQKKYVIGLLSSAGYIQESFDKDISHAYQLQFGGFVQREISSHLSAGFEAGFVFNSAGIDFSKNSAVTQYGFGLRSTINNLELKRSYFAYGGIHLQYRMSRHILTGGIHTKYLYGAQGNIERFVEDDFGAYQEEVLENVWIETEGMEKISIDGLIGYGYQLFPNLNVQIQARLPLKSTSGERNQELFNDDYILESTKQKLIPEISLRYSLFRL
jgi:hypothetical protein